MSKAKDTIASVDKACWLLREAAGMGVFSLSEMARTLDVPTSTADRLVKTLASHQLLERRGDLWRLGPTARSIWAESIRALRRERQEIDEELNRIEIGEAKE